MMYVDIFGKEKTLIIAFRGYNPFSFGEIDPDNYNKVGGLGLTLNTFKNQQNVTTKFYNSSLTKIGSEKWDALDYIKQNKNNYDNIVILGHSVGGDNAVELTQLLNEEDIKVNLLVTVDLQAISNTTEVPNNVQFAKNYYQTNPGIYNPNGSLLTQSPDSRPASYVSNIKVNNHCDTQECNEYDDNYLVTHTAIDGELSNKITKDIRSYTK